MEKAMFNIDRQSMYSKGFVVIETGPFIYNSPHPFFSMH